MRNAWNALKRNHPQCITYVLCIRSVGVTCRTYLECVLTVFSQIPIASIWYASNTSDICSAYGEYIVHTLHIWPTCLFCVKVWRVTFQSISCISHTLYASVTGSLPLLMSFANAVAVVTNYIWYVRRHIICTYEELLQNTLSVIKRNGFQMSIPSL